MFRTATHRGQQHRQAKQRKHEHTLEKINKEENAERNVLVSISTNPSSKFSPSAVKERMKIKQRRIYKNGMKKKGRKKAPGNKKDLKWMNWKANKRSANGKYSIWWEPSEGKDFDDVRPPPRVPLQSAPSLRKVLPATRVFRLDWFRQHDCSQVNQSINDQISFLSVLSSKVRRHKSKHFQIVRVSLQREKLNVAERATWHYLLRKAAAQLYVIHMDVFSNYIHNKQHTQWATREPHRKSNNERAVSW